MDDPLLVRGFEGLGDRQRLINGNRALHDAVGQRRPLDQFHDERLHTIGIFEAVDLRDVRMVQRGKPFSFALEAGNPF